MPKEWKRDLKKIVNINSYTGNKRGVDKCGELFAEWMGELGFECERFKRELVGDHLLFRSKVSGTRERVLLLGHLDTVFPPGTFEGFREDDEWVYGPGVCDMKGGNIVALESLRKVFERFGKIEDIDFLLVSDEETGSDDSKLVTSSLAQKYDNCFVFEAAGANMEVVIGRKGIGTFEIVIDGVASHAGTAYENGCDANLEAALKLRELASLTDLQKGTTVNIGRIEGGVGANTVSPRAKLLLELRYANNKERARLMEALAKIVEHSFVDGTSARLAGAIQRDVMEPNEWQMELIKEIEKISGVKIKTESRGGVSDANIAASAGVVTLDGLGPYGDGDHTDKERALKSSFEERIDLMTKVLLHHQKEGAIRG
ncbi:MAG: M20 family metallopeptidase [Hydrogenimonas sp.]|nr:M20 family metallopeptidase [Hydrogenimonas sp.]